MNITIVALTIVVSFLVLLQSIQTLIETRQKHYDDYILRKDNLKLDIKKKKKKKKKKN